VNSIDAARNERTNSTEAERMNLNQEQYRFEALRSTAYPLTFLLDQRRFTLRRDDRADLHSKTRKHQTCTSRAS